MVVVPENLPFDYWLRVSTGDFYARKFLVNWTVLLNRNLNMENKIYLRLEFTCHLR